MTKALPPRPEMPHYAKVTWRATTPTESKGLNVHKITRAAINIADRSGVTAVTIRSIAKETGFSTMALYRHVESRDELMLLLVDAVLGPAPAFTLGRWQDDVHTWATSLLERYAAHPWVIEILITGIPTTPNHISWVELILRILAPTDLSLQARLDTALLLDGHVRQFANLSALDSLKSDHISDIVWLQEVASNVAPTLMLALQQGAMQSKKGPDFNVGLDTIIRGIQRD